MIFRDFGNSALNLDTKMFEKSILVKFGVSYVENCFANHSQAANPYELPPRVRDYALDKSKLSLPPAAASTSSAESNFFCSALIT